MAEQLAEWTRRMGVTVVGLVAAGGLVAGCSSSGGGHPSTGTTGNGVTTGNSTTAGGGGSSTSGGGGGNKDPFCSGYTPLQLSGLGNASNINDVVKAWDNYANTAPSDIKQQAKDVAKYLHDFQNKDYSTLSTDAQKIGTDLQQIGTYIASHCHG